jgi:hypothetical protein
MPTKVPASSSARISNSFKELADSAARLNSASDELAKAILPIDAALKKLNLGVAAWYPYVDSEDRDSGHYHRRFIGYAKVGRKWGLALSTVSGNFNWPEPVEEEEEWLFNDAPRWMRIEALDHIPNLLELLVEQANTFAENLRKKTEHARELADTISELSGAAQVRR